MASAVRVIDRIRDQADFAGPPTPGLVRYTGTTFETFAGAAVGLKTIFTSQVTGVVLNATADALGTYGRNNTPEIQATLDAIGGPVELVFDGPSVIDTLELWPGSKLRGLACHPQFGLYRKGRPNGGRTMILNKHSVLGPTAPTDKFIEISDLYIDENQRGYGSGNTGGSWVGLDDDTFQHVFNDLGWIVHCIGLYGVQYFRVGNIYIYDQVGYALNLGNCLDGHVHDFRKYRRPGHTVTFDAIVQFQGHCHRVECDRIGGEARDDALACNANDGQDDPAATIGPEPGQVSPGPISDLTFRDCKLGNVMQVCRFLSAAAANPIKNITFDGVTATIGWDVVYGYAAFLVDDFAVPGDGTHGLVDGLKILNVTVDGNHTGAGDGFAPVHMGRCNVKRLEVRNFRYRGNGNPPTAVVQSTVDAKVETLVVERAVHEGQVPIMPVVMLKGQHKTVEVIEPEYDMLVAGPSFSQPQFRDTCLVQVAGPVDHLMLEGGRGVGLSNAVRCVGFAPKNLTVNGVSLWASKGGAVVRSDTALPRLSVSARDADHLDDVPAGSMVKANGFAWYDARYLWDLFPGASGVALAGSTATDGSIWRADTAGANQLKTSGTNTVYLAGGSSFTATAVSAQPPTPSAAALAALMFPSFEVEFDAVRLSSVASGDGIGATLFATGAGDLTDYYWLRFAGASFDVMHNSTPVSSSGSLPAVGVTWRVRATVYAVPNTNDKRIVTDYSSDGGRSWSNLLPTAYVTTTTPALVGLRGVGTTGWTATTGHHLGPVVIRSFSQPVPGPYVPPVTAPTVNIVADADTYQTVGGTAATANNDPVGQCLDQSGNAHHAQQTTSGKRATLIVPGQNGYPVLRFAGGGTEQSLIIPNYAPAPPWTLFLVFKVPASGTDKELLGWGNNGTGLRYGVWHNANHTMGAENAGTIRSGSAVLTPGTWHILTHRQPDTDFSHLTQRIDGTNDPMTGGAGLFAFSGAVELKIGGIPTLEGIGYDVTTDIPEFYLVVGPVLSDADCASVEGPRRTKWATP